MKQKSIMFRHTGFPILNKAFTVLVLVWQKQSHGSLNYKH